MHRFEIAEPRAPHSNTPSTMKANVMINDSPHTLVLNNTELSYASASSEEFFTGACRLSDSKMICVASDKDRHSIQLMTRRDDVGSVLEVVFESEHVRDDWLVALMAAIGAPTSAAPAPRASESLLSPRTPKHHQQSATSLSTSSNSNSASLLLNDAQRLELTDLLRYKSALTTKLSALKASNATGEPTADVRSQISEINIEIVSSIDCGELLLLLLLLLLLVTTFAAVAVRRQDSCTCTNVKENVESFENDDRHQVRQERRLDAGLVAATTVVTARHFYSLLNERSLPKQSREKMCNSPFSNAVGAESIRE
jgi:hypothetical protein